MHKGRIYQKVAKRPNSAKVRVPAVLGLVYDLISVGRTVGGMQVAKIGSFAGEVNDVGKIDGVADQAGGIHEMIGDFVAGEQRDLDRRESTRMGPMRLRLPVKLLEKMMKTQQMSRLSKITKIFIRVMQKLPIMYSSGKVCFAVALMLLTRPVALQKGQPYMMVPRCEYLLSPSHSSLWQQQNRLQQPRQLSSQPFSSELSDSGMKARTEPKAIVPMCLNERPMLGSKLDAKALQYWCLYLLQLQYQWRERDWKRKSEQDFRKPWVQSAQKMTRQASRKRSTASWPSFCAIAKLMNWMLANQAAIVTPDSSTDTPNTQQLSQKHSCASFSEADTNFSRCCFPRITNNDPANPTMHPTPHTSVSSEYLLTQDCWYQAGRKGSLLPKKRYRKPAPSASMRSRQSGMQRQAETEGRQQVVSTSKMQMAVATANPIRMSGITCWVERQGMSWPFVLRSCSICGGLRCSAELASRDSEITATSRSRQSTQHRQSVHLRSRVGPSLHCTCSWIYCSSSSIIQISFNINNQAIHL